MKWTSSFRNYGVYIELVHLVITKALIEMRFQVQNNSTDDERTLYAPTAECHMNRKLDQFKGGPGLAFIAFTEAMSQMAVGPLWSFLFFVMVFVILF